jgi:hypothetical protein
MANTDIARRSQMISAGIHGDGRVWPFPHDRRRAAPHHALHGAGPLADRWKTRLARAGPHVLDPQPDAVLQQPRDGRTALMADRVCPQPSRPNRVCLV